MRLPNLAPDLAQLCQVAGRRRVPDAALAGWGLAAVDLVWGWDLVGVVLAWAWGQVPAGLVARA